MWTCACWKQPYVKNAEAAILVGGGGVKPKVWAQGPVGGGGILGLGGEGWKAK